MCAKISLLLFQSLFPQRSLHIFSQGLGRTEGWTAVVDMVISTCCKANVQPACKHKSATAAVPWDTAAAREKIVVLSQGQASPDRKLENVPFIVCVGVNFKRRLVLS